MPRIILPVGSGMASVKIARFAVRPEARMEAERAMHEYASLVRRTLRGTSWTTYRHTMVPTYLAVMHTDDPDLPAFAAVLAPFVDGAVEQADVELVTSSDLQRRLSPEATVRARRRPRRP